jgi:hypothetical protein
MKKIVLGAAILIILIEATCTAQPTAPLIIDGKLLIPAGQTLVIPEGGILFSSGNMIGGAQ